MLDKFLIVYPIIFFMEGFTRHEDYQAVIIAARAVNDLADADLIWICYMGNPYPLSDPIERNNGFFEIGKVNNSDFMRYYNKLLKRAGNPPPPEQI